MSDIPDATASGDEELAFGPFRLFPKQRLLLELDRPVALGSRALDILTILADRAGQRVSKKELFARVWPGTFATEGSLRVHVAGLRRALGDGQDGRRFIVTTPGQGYCFVAPISRPGGRAPNARHEAPEPASDNLPRLLAKMVGRDGAIESLLAELPHRRLISIVGPGGVGKTTLALAAAGALRPSFRDGVRFVDLAPVADPALVPSVLAGVLGLRVNSDDIIPNLLGVLRGKQMLLLLDNCERMVDAAAILADKVSKSAPSVHILATTREALRVDGEYVRRLPPLDAPTDIPGITARAALAFPAVQLFVERMNATLDSFELSDGDAPAVAEICRRLDGIPLAIELAAARVESLGARGVASRLDDRFRLLTHGRRTALPHHQTLKAAFDWSYDSLSEPVRVLFRRLSVLAGEFTLDSAIAIGGVAGTDKSDVANQVAGLVSASLVTANITGARTRYRYLDSTRAYACDSLVECGEFGRFARRHCEHMLEVLSAATHELAECPSEEWLSRHSRHVGDVRVALDWAISSPADQMLGVDLTIAAAPLWALTSLNEECRSRVEAALASLGPGAGCDGRRRMQLLAALGAAVMYAKGMRSSSGQIWEDVLRAADDLGDIDYQLRALKGLWTEAYNGGNAQSAVMLGKRLSEVAAISTNSSDRSLDERVIAMNGYYVGDFRAARFHIERALDGLPTSSSALDLVRFQFDLRVVASAIHGTLLWFQGYPDQASRMSDLSVERAKEADHGRSVTWVLGYSACKMQFFTGNVEQFEQHLLDLFQTALLDPSGQWDLMGRCWKGVLLGLHGDAGAGADLLTGALKGVPENSYRLYHTLFLGELAHLLARAGEFGRAVEAIDRAVAICDHLGERWYFAELLRIKGEITRMEGGSTAAAAAEDQFEQSLDWARRQGALSLELRAATSLARSRLAQARHHDASALLAPVYGRFTEGFATSDLRAAKDLLDRLA